MEELQMENLIKGVATGKYIPQIGSQFGSIWVFDGLMEAEATPEQYAAFGNLPNVHLCHGKPINWLGQQWSVMLAYKRRQLAQVNVQTGPNDSTFAAIASSLDAVFSKGREVELPDDMQSVIRRVVWNGKDGEVWAVCTKTYLQVSVQRQTWLRRAVAWILRKRDSLALLSQRRV